MLPKYSRRLIISGLASFSALPALANAPSTSLRPVVRGAEFFKRAVPGADRIISEAKLNGHVCFAVADVATGRQLEAGNAQRGSPPASVTKAVTALYALETLGAGHRFTTKLVATGPVSNGALQGDLLLVGGGDPTLSTDDLAALAQNLKDAGIREVRGAFKVVDGNMPRIPSIDPGQPEHVGYSPGISGIALNFNRVHFEWRRRSGKYQITMEARTNRYRPEVVMAQMRLAERAAPVYTYNGSGARDEWTVARGALGSGGARWLPVRKPGLYAGDVFQTLARGAGIALKNPKVVRTAPSGQVIASRSSAPLRDVLEDMLKFSTNLTAEMVGLAATAQRKGRPANLAASAREMSRWAEERFATKGINLVDHSGLGGSSKMTAAAMVAALVKAHAASGLPPILKPVSVRDARGRPVQGHPIKVMAKTGTLNFVSGLAGYMNAPGGQTLAFAIFAADETTRKRIAKADRESPRGAKSWNNRAKAMHQRLIQRWGQLYVG